MDGLNEAHLSHIGRVRVSFYVSAPDLNPDEVTAAIGVEPDFKARRGDERRNYGGQVVSPHEKGVWMISTKGRVNSKDVNKHFFLLLRILLPHQEALARLVQQVNGETDFDVLWESSYLYAGTGPLLSRDAIKGASELEAAIGFDIYQIEGQEGP